MDFLTAFLKAFALMTLIQSLRYLFLSGGAFGLTNLLSEKWKQKHRIQNKPPEKKFIIAELKNSAVTMIVYGLLIGFFFNKELIGHTKIYFQAEDYGWPWMIISFILIWLIHDTYFYWMHRLMHEIKFLRPYHHAHHMSLNPTPFASQSFHWVEGVFEIIWVVPVIYLIPFHQGTLIAFSFFTLLYNIYGHLGFEIMPSSFRQIFFFRWLNTSTHHNLHHKAYLNGNYGFYFLFWDRWMKTEKG